MALIYADDFQQLKYAQNIVMFGSSDTITEANYVNNGIEAMGFERPIAIQLRQGNVGNNQYYIQTPVGYWVNAGYNALCIYVRSPTSFVSEGIIAAPGVNALKRKIAQKGDTVFINFRWSFHPSIRFNTTMVDETFIQAGAGIYIALSATGTIKLNGIDTGYNAIFGDAEVPLITEIIAGPDYVELWIGSDFVARQDRQPLPIDYFTLGFERVTALTGSKFFQSQVTIKLFSLIIADNSGTSFKTRIGRKVVQTFEANAVTTDATLQTYSSTTAVNTIRRPVQDLGLDTGLPVFGNLYSPKPFVKTTLAGLKPIDLVVRGACVHMQAKRRTPTVDGLMPFPFITIGGTTYTDTVGQSMRSRWTGKCTPIDVPANGAFTAFDFGYTNDYPDVEKLFVDDRTKVEIYGTQDVPYVPPLLVFQSRIPAVTQKAMQTAQYGAYSYDYTTTKLNLNNLTYMQEQ